jgi:hypothetical protein
LLEPVAPASLLSIHVVFRTVFTSQAFELEWSNNKTHAGCIVMFCHVSNIQPDGLRSIPLITMRSIRLL